MNVRSALLLIALLSAITSVRAQPGELPTAWSSLAQAKPVPFAEYPRPQLQRKEWLCLNGTWDYVGGKTAPDAQHPESTISFSANPEKIKVPYCPESWLSGIKRKQEINMWYRKTVRIPATWNGKQVLLHLDAVDHTATVFVNGQKAGRHEGGYDGFVVNITSFLKKRG